MGDAGDKFDKFAGKAKEGAGKVTGDEDLEREGKADQAKAAAKEAAKEAKEKAGEAAEKAKDVFKR
ncbi:CsbD family protein [Nocardiopsis potens]|uniref:CsbD family protein n=1 Tax=Nocardiopsis potens TaxID=1246458 RepID=UPI00034B9788|nr:CsbD family protein [Nocardiopsis potens]